MPHLQPKTLLTVRVSLSKPIEKWNRWIWLTDIGLSVYLKKPVSLILPHSLFLKGTNLERIDKQICGL